MALLIRTCIVVALLTVTSARAEDTILVLRSRDQPQYNAAAAGFSAAWTGQRIKTVILEGGAVDLRADGEVVAVVAIGTEAAKWAVTNTTVPVVFSMVANAQQNLLDPLSMADGARVTGISLDFTVRTQWEQLKRALPNVRRVGILFDPRKSSGAVKEAMSMAGELGLQVVTQEVASESAIPDAVGSIASRIDVLWAPVDSTVYSGHNAQFVLTQMLQRKIPVMGFSENMVKAGALLGPRMDYDEIGRQTADLVRVALKNDSAGNAPMQPPHHFNLVVNARVLRLIGAPIPPSVLPTLRFINED